MQREAGSWGCARLKVGRGGCTGPRGGQRNHGPGSDPGCRWEADDASAGDLLDCMRGCATTPSGAKVVVWDEAADGLCRVWAPRLWIKYVVSPP